MAREREWFDCLTESANVHCVCSLLLMFLLVSLNVV